MSIFDSIKSAFSSKEEGEPDITTSPSQMLREAGIDPGGLEFDFGADSITVAGEISDESRRQEILDILAGTPGITAVHDNMQAPVPAPAEPEDETESDAAISPDEAVELQSPESGTRDAGDSAARTYTVQSGDTLWRIAEKMYGNGSSYMKIFEANTGLLEDPDRIFPGQELVIPELDD